MLIQIHKHMSWIMWGIIILITVTFLFFGIYPSSVTGSMVANVNGDVITGEDLNRVYRNLYDTYKQIFKDQFNEAMTKTLRAQALARAGAEQAPCPGGRPHGPQDQR